MIATESDGVTKNLRPKIMLRSASPSAQGHAARGFREVWRHVATAAATNAPAAAPKSGTLLSSAPSAATPADVRPAKGEQLADGRAGSRVRGERVGTTTHAPIASTRSCAYVRFGSGWPPPKSCRVRRPGNRVKRRAGCAQQQRRHPPEAGCSCSGCPRQPQGAPQTLAVRTRRRLQPPTVTQSRLAVIMQGKMLQVQRLTRTARERVEGE